MVLRGVGWSELGHGSAKSRTRNLSVVRPDTRLIPHTDPLLKILVINFFLRSTKIVQIIGQNISSVEFFSDKYTSIGDKNIDLEFRGGKDNVDKMCSVGSQ